MSTIFITGAGRGIGLALAQTYAAAGWRVLAGVRDPEGATALKAVTGEIYPLDVADAASVAALGEALEGVAIDVLINNAGVLGPRPQSSLDVDLDAFMDVLAVNTVGPLRVTRALLPNLRLAKAAKIAVISSRMGAMSGQGTTSVAYRTSKAGVNKIVQVLAADLKPEGIAVASLHPGWVRTDMGGSGADIEVSESVAGIKAVVDGLSVATTGRFWNYDGTPMAW
jgi:NAD(P)-dependent dehydrogenase (short-subunit alcohol dehydrogenase family)